MKSKKWILPILALAGSGTWGALQRNEAMELRREITVIHERIRQVRSMAESEAAQQAAQEQKSRRVNWKDTGEKIGDSMSGQAPDFRTIIKIQRLLFELSALELCAHIEEIEALEMDEDVRYQLLTMVIEALVLKDPKLALDSSFEKGAKKDHQFNWHMSNALNAWADKEPQAAVAWLNQQIEAGNFESKSLDGVNKPRMFMERALAAALLKSDPAATKLRVMSMSESERAAFFDGGYLHNIYKANSESYAKLVREAMPPDKAIGILANTAGRMASRRMTEERDYNRLDSYIAAARPNDEEKKAIISKVFESALQDDRTGKKMDADKLEKLHTWGMTHSQVAAEQATGEALANFTALHKDFDSVSSIAIQYAETSGNDRILAAFLKDKKVRAAHAEKAAALIPKIKDQTLRSEITALKEYGQPTPEP